MTLRSSSRFNEFSETAQIVNQTSLGPMNFRDFISKHSPNKPFSSRLLFELDEEKKSVISLGNLLTKTDEMGEEIRHLKKVIVNLEEEKTQLLRYKNQAYKSKSEYNSLERENDKLKKEIEIAREEITEMDNNRKLEMEKLKKSFDEMDELLIKEKEEHKTEEEELLGRIAQLESKLEIAELKIKEMTDDLNKLNQLKDDAKKLKEKLDLCKKRENDNNEIYNKTNRDLKVNNDKLEKTVENLIIENNKLKVLLEDEKHSVNYGIINRMNY